MKKAGKVKIISITCHGNCIYGLGNDGKIYYWSISGVAWYLND